ncbi:WD40 repeat domain-containing protein [Marinoscillum sp.]|uniref:WD40 repeat domain-containing protein n=1 Tax=Marinoscillum sp. TaxID=2024838 RepID=UPI003BABBD7A
MKLSLTLIISLLASVVMYGQPSKLDLETEIAILRTTELVQSMSQRSLLTPSYFPERKALVARQAYNFWIENPGDRLVSHLNVYQALYYANKYLGYDPVKKQSFNQALGHNESVIGVQYGANANTFYTAGSDGKVIRWQLEEGFNTPEVIYEGDHLIRSLDISDDGELILVVTKQQGIIIMPAHRQATTSDEESELAIDRELVQSGVFMPGENKVAVVTKNGELKIKGFGKEETIGRTSERVSSMEVNKSNKEILVGTASGNVQFWEDTLARKLYIEEAFAVNAMAISSDYKTLALGREKGDVVLYDLEKHEMIRIISGHQSAITDVDFNFDGTKLLSASRDGSVRVWDVNDPRKLPLVLDDHTDWVMSACFSPDGKRVISGSRDNYIRFWPVDHQELADRICTMVNRNLSKEEWVEYVGTSIEYTETCPVSN